ncbi:DAK2 domain-containing protein [Bosea sp. BK604]|uniref:DAK2 domain-containing protein n=1 Tax=Bosea sp. BK604 TaxID=2512180 RepID=UPI0010D16889|nr:DAK2 domain-containing protein [Bosea sp. BK604]TCR66134.1 dihydroxyacetone kinase-like protein [Bosea sp. BK604]
MSGIELAALAGAVARAKARMATLEQELNLADSRLGDGDTGVMLARVVDAMAAIDYAAEPDIGAALGLMARKTASATGSSLGTLIATGLLTVSKRVKGEPAIAYADLGGHIAAVVAAMAARGGATLGDKTVLDILDALARALDGKGDGASAASAAVEACRTTLAEFRDRPCRIGRARMFAEKSIGMDDPGMLAVHELVLAIAAPATA